MTAAVPLPSEYQPGSRRANGGDERDQLRSPTRFRARPDSRPSTWGPHCVALEKRIAEEAVKRQRFIQDISRFRWGLHGHERISEDEIRVHRSASRRGGPAV